MYRPRQVRDYMRCLPQVGINPVEFFRNAPVSYEDITNLVPVTQAQMAALFDMIALDTPDRFSFLCGTELPPTHLGVMGHALVNCGTLRELLSLWVRYSAVCHHPFSGQLRTEGNRWVLVLPPRFSLSPDSLRFCAESSVVGFTLIAQRLLQQPDLLQNVHLPFPQPQDQGRYEDLRLGSVTFNAPLLRLDGALATLDTPIATADNEVRELCEMRCAQQLTTYERTVPLGDQLRLLLNGSERLPSLTASAALLGLSVRSLNRGLQSEGVSYRNLIDDVRRHRAEARLCSGAASIKEVAWELGFSDPRNFQRVFRQWTGQPIGRWMKSPRTLAGRGLGSDLEYRDNIGVNWHSAN